MQAQQLGKRVRLPALHMMQIGLLRNDSKKEAAFVSWHLSPRGRLAQVMHKTECCPELFPESLPTCAGAAAGRAAAAAAPGGLAGGAADERSADYAYE